MASLFFAAGCLFAASPASAYPATVTWTTYLRAGPGMNYATLDEIDGGTPLEVLNCTGDWCRVLYEKTETFIQSNLLTQASTPMPPSPQSAANCFDARRDGYERGETYRYCIK